MESQSRQFTMEGHEKEVHTDARMTAPSLQEMMAGTESMCAIAYATIILPMLHHAHLQNDDDNNKIDTRKKRVPLQSSSSSSSSSSSPSSSSSSRAASSFSFVPHRGCFYACYLMVLLQRLGMSQNDRRLVVAPRIFQRTTDIFRPLSIHAGFCIRYKHQGHGACVDSTTRRSWITCLVFCIRYKTRITSIDRYLSRIA